MAGNHVGKVVVPTSITIEILTVHTFDTLLSNTRFDLASINAAANNGNPKIRRPSEQAGKTLHLAAMVSRGMTILCRMR